MTRDELKNKLTALVKHWCDMDKAKKEILAEFDRLTSELAEAQENVQAFGHLIVDSINDEGELKL